MSTASVVGALRVSLGLDTATFQAGLGKAQKTLGSFGAKMKATFASFGKIAKAAFVAIVAAGTAAFAALSVGAIKLAGAAKEISQMSKAFGISSDAYQGLVLGASKFGIEQDKVNDILKDSSEKLGGYLSTGAGGFKDFMEQVAAPAGVSANDLFQLPPEERLIKMVSLMEAAGMGAEQQSFYLESVASDLTLLIPLLANGGKLTKEMTAEFEKQGLILSGTVISNLTAFKTSLGSIGDTMAGWGNILISGMSGPLAEITGKLANFLKNSDAIRVVFATVGVVAGQVITLLSTSISSIITYFQNIENVGGRVGSILTSLGTIWANVVIVFQAASPLILGILTVIKDAVFLIGDTFISSFDIALKAIAAISGPISTIAALIFDTLGGAVTWIGDQFNAIADKASMAFELTLAYASGAATAIVDAFRSLPGALADLMYQASNGVISAIGSMVDGAINTMKAAIDTLNSYVDTGYSIAASNLANSMKINNPYAGAAANAGKGFGETFNAEANKVIAKNQFKTAFGKSPQLTGLPPGLVAPNKPATPAMVTSTGLVNPPARPPVTPPSAAGGGGGAGAGDADAKAQTKAYTDLQKRVASLGQTFGMTALQKKIFDETQKVGTAASADAVAALVTQEDRLTRFQDVMNDVGQSFTSNFEGMLNGTKSFKDALGGFLSDIASMLARSALNSLWGGISGSVGGWLGGLGGGAGAGIGANANGTTNWAGGLSMVGERGPELINLNKGSSVYNAAASKRMLAGGGGVTRVEVSYSQDAEARIIGTAKNNSVTLVKQGVSAVEKALPSRINNYQSDSRKR